MNLNPLYTIKLPVYESHQLFSYAVELIRPTLQVPGAKLANILLSTDTNSNLSKIAIFS